jgi:hypothetical protein
MEYLYPGASIPILACPGAEISHKTVPRSLIEADWWSPGIFTWEERTPLVPQYFPGGQVPRGSNRRSSYMADRYSHGNHSIMGHSPRNLCCRPSEQWRFDHQKMGFLTGNYCRLDSTVRMISAVTYLDANPSDSRTDGRLRGGRGMRERSARLKK